MPPGMPEREREPIQGEGRGKTNWGKKIMGGTKESRVQDMRKELKRRKKWEWKVEK